ncbi:TonB-dependent receptor [Catenovulum agarivorans]|uniref:TonB-dependent receptor n=1 Tax=Catenovulum agarivorans TaxID=1172192 RepID=UPI0002E129DC|nr:TonB-dependent receptor [Catenovulum agarivorans]
MYLKHIPFIPTAIALTIATSIKLNAQEVEQTTNEEQTQAEAKKKADATEVIQVTGLRASMIKAQEIKMTSDSIMDVIVAEDIGKLPDKTAAESIARITGVQVTRSGDEANGVLIRGLPDVTTSYNGREIFTGELRRVQLMDMPSQAIAGIEVYKSGTAKVIEPGLAGLVNIRTSRPFDFADQIVAGGIHVSYNDQSERTDPNYNLLYSNRWQTSLGEVGFLANVTKAQSQYYNGVRYGEPFYPRGAEWWDISPEQYADGNFTFPIDVGIYNDGGKRERPSANVAIQWKPNDNLELYFDGIYQGYRGKGYIDKFWTNLNFWHPEFGDPKLTDVVLVEGTEDQAQSFTKSGGIPQEGFRSTNEGKTNTNQVATGAIWTSDNLKIHTDLAYTNSRFDLNEWSLDFALTEPQTVTANFNTGKGVAWDLPNFNVMDESLYKWRGYFERTLVTEGDGLQWRTDFTYYTPWDLVSRIETGFRYSDRNASIKSGARYARTMDLNIPLTDLPVGELSLTLNPFRGDEQGFTQYLVPSREGIAANNKELRQLAYEALQELVVTQPWVQADLDRYAKENVELDPATYFLANEKSYAAYLQSDYILDAGSIEIDGVVGVRVIRTDIEMSGTSTVNNGEGGVINEPRNSKDSYTDVLPNVSLRAKLTDDLQLRLGYTKTRTKVHFGDLNPALNISQIVDSGETDPNAPEEDWDAIGHSGNPDLKPLTSTNYDISLEYYFSETGYLSAAGFYRDLFGFTKWFERNIETPDYGTVRLNRPENTGEGEVYGYELNAQTFFDFFPGDWKHFGISANATYLKGKIAQPTVFGEQGEYGPILGLSDWTYNAAIFFEKGAFGTRLSYNYRTPWVYDTQFHEGQLYDRKTRARDRLDFSVRYDITENYLVYADIGNLLARPFRNYSQITPNQYFPIDVRDEGRYFGLGFRFKFE